MARPLVALVGRPNVGKSTLFNRLVGERLAIVEDEPGTTRDRLYGTSDWNGREFGVVDTGGFMPGAEDEFGVRVREQALLAMQEADVIVFLVDAKDGLTADDYEVADLLRTTSKPVVLGVNKADNLARSFDAVEFYALGLGEPIPVSAHHGTGTGDLLDVVVAALPPAETEPADEATAGIPRVAIIGRPNVGKSSIVNAILGQERVIVSEVPGTTRDAIDTLIDHQGQPMLLIDTAGIRRRGRIDRGIEKYAVLRAMRALDRTDIAVIVLDAADGLTAQDTHIIGYALDAFRGIVVAVNKWDLIVKDDKTMQAYTQHLRQELRFLDWAPIVFVSAVTKQRLGVLLDTVLRVKVARDVRVPTPQLNQVVQDAYRQHVPPSHRGRPLKILYVTQPDTDPPTFVFFVNDPDLVHFSYKRYLENQLRAAFGFEGNPLKLYFRARGEDRPD